jgi:hypothetical protein
MDETPHEPRRPDDDPSGLQSEPTTEKARGEPPPPSFPNDPTTPNPTTPNPPGGPPPLDDDADGDEDDDGSDETGPSRRRFLSGGRVVAAGVVVLALLGGGVGFALTGEGGGEDDEADGQADDQESMEDAAFEFAECMREHGVDMPDPQVNSDGGISLGGRAGDPGEVSPQEREEAEAAQEACQSILDDALPEGMELTPEEQAEMQDQALAMAQCMRDKGWENFPDPEVDENGGMRIQLDPDSGLPGPDDPNADQFGQDQEDCLDEAGLDGPDGGPGEGPGGSSSSEEGDA